MSREPFGALRSVRAHFFCTFHGLSFELNFFDWSLPLRRLSGTKLVQDPLKVVVVNLRASFVKFSNGNVLQIR